MFTFRNSSRKSLIPTLALLFVALTGCDAQDRELDDAPSADILEEDSDPADPFQAEGDEGSEFRGANVCHHQCNKNFSSCLSACNGRSRHGFAWGMDERCLARCEAALGQCKAKCDKPRPNPSGITVQGPCFNFSATASGGLGGFRVLGAGSQEFFRFNPRGRGRICTGSGKKVRFDVEKLLDPNIDVTITVQGRNFRFPRGNRGDRLMNSWFRKYFDVYVK